MNVNVNDYDAGLVRALLAEMQDDSLPPRTRLLISKAAERLTQQAAAKEAMPAGPRPQPVWWIVTLREDGDDEESLYIVQADDQEGAETAARAQFIEDRYGAEPTEPTLYLNHTVRCVSDVTPELVRVAP